MKLLFLTQVIDADDAVLGFVSRWVAGLAKCCERVRVIALEVGDIDDLPDNVDVREVGRKGQISRYLRYKRFLREALVRDEFDRVLAHMVPRYALVAAGPARRARAGLYLWYTTKGVDGRLKRAERRVERIFTASPESLRIETSKKVVTGHGIDLAHFTPPGPGEPPGRPRILSVGRLTPAKDPLTVLAAVSILVSRGHDLQLDLVGGGLTEADRSYGRTVDEQIEVGGLAERVHMQGLVSYREVPAIYRRATCLVNASLTGSLDKVVLEAMACGLPFVSCNDASPGVVAELGEDAQRFLFPAGDADALADRIEGWLTMEPAQRDRLGLKLRSMVEREHEVDRLMRRLVLEME